MNIMRFGGFRTIKKLLLNIGNNFNSNATGDPYKERKYIPLCADQQTQTRFDS